VEKRERIPTIPECIEGCLYLYILPPITPRGVVSEKIGFGISRPVLIISMAMSRPYFNCVQSVRGLV
jgi:hypothetical protein